MTPHPVLVLLLAAILPSAAAAQGLSQRGFVDARATLFPQQAANDSTRAVGDVLAREEVFVDATGWLQAAAGVDLRANSHDQVDASWTPDFEDRGTRRPALSIRRLSVGLARGPFTVDVGKQFVRWGTTDIVTPTDRFAPRDFLDVVNDEFLPVVAARVVASYGAESVEAVWAPRFTPSRLPLLDQRWTATPAAAGLRLHDVERPLPGDDQAGVRWTHLGAGYEVAAAFFDGWNHLPDLEIVSGSTPLDIGVGRRYPRIRMYGGDAAVPLPWLTIKGEAAYVTSSTPGADEYVLYVVQLERQSGEWLFIGGYAGELVTERRAALSFAPDRGLTRALVARASYTIDTNRSVAFEGTARQDGHGAYLEAEYSQAHGAHWRGTVAGVLIAGRATDFIGQYRRNSHVALSLRYSF